MNEVARLPAILESDPANSSVVNSVVQGQGAAVATGVAKATGAA